MKVLAAIVFICVSSFVLMPGCSSDEEQPVKPEKKVVVKKAIKMPDQKEGGAVVPVQEKEPVPGTKGSVKAEVAEVKENKPQEPSKTVKEEDKGYYLTKKGESLSMIAGKKDVYADPLKWPILYRLNKDILVGIGSDADSPEKEIPGGTKLKIITRGQAEENLKKGPKKTWVVNVLSSPKKERIVPTAIRLMKNGYYVYVTRTKVRGKDWMRLRVGFFSLKKDADVEGKKIMALINIPEVWITNAGTEEYMEFGGYY